MTFILKDESTVASNGAPRTPQPALPLERRGSGLPGELMAQCGSSFFCFSVVFFSHSGGRAEVHSTCPPTLMYIMYIYCTSLYIITRYVCPLCDGQYNVARLPGSDLKMGERVGEGEGEGEGGRGLQRWGGAY